MSLLRECFNNLDHFGGCNRVVPKSRVGFLSFVIFSISMNRKEGITKAKLFLLTSLFGYCYIETQTSENMYKVLLEESA